MNLPTDEPTTRQSIDLTGLPEEVVRAVQSLVGFLKMQTRPAGAAPASFSSSGEWRSRFNEWMREVTARSGRYPPGFVVDDRRETIYEGRGE
jgi:hypothetical protein